jgi:hypothetical protein
LIDAPSMRYAVSADCVDHRGARRTVSRKMRKRLGLTVGATLDG